MLSLNILLLLLPSVLGYSLDDLPHTWQEGQSGYNDCTSDSETSLCQTAVINSLTDFCLWAPPSGHQTIGDSERYEVAWCTKAGHGTRLIPEGAITGAHFVETPHYVQVTGVGDFTGMNIKKGDLGGELDPHGADGNGNPIGGLVFSNGEQITEWTSFIGATQFCFRACKTADDAWLYCQHIYDLQGCEWNEPGNYGEGFDTCEGDSTEYPGIYVTDGKTSTYNQNSGTAPAPHKAGKTSNCKTLKTIPYGGSASSVASTSQATASASGSGKASSSVSGSGSGSLSATASSVKGSKSVSSSVALNAPSSISSVFSSSTVRSLSGASSSVSSVSSSASSSVSSIDSFTGHSKVSSRSSSSSATSSTAPSGSNNNSNSSSSSSTPYVNPKASSTSLTLSIISSSASTSKSASKTSARSVSSSKSDANAYSLSKSSQSSSYSTSKSIASQSSTTSTHRTTSTPQANANAVSAASPLNPSRIYTALTLSALVLLFTHL